MTIFEYLQEKYPKGQMVLTSLEAKAFGVRYPLQPGWLKDVGHVYIAPQTAKDLAKKLVTKAMKTQSDSKAEYCARGAAILIRAAAQEISR